MCRTLTAVLAVWMLLCVAACTSEQTKSTGDAAAIVSPKDSSSSAGHTQLRGGEDWLPAARSVQADINVMTNIAPTGTVQRVKTRGAEDWSTR